MSTFFRQFLSNFHETGAIAPSSRWLARALTRALTERGEEPIQVLEAGPGTGALTVEIVKHLKPGDHLTLAEVNPDFVRVLRERFESDPRLSPHRDQMTIHEGPVQDVAEVGKFDHVVCGLPYNNFPPDLVREILESLLGCLKPGGTLNFFEYVALRRLKAPFVGREERARLRGVAEAMGEQISAHERSKKMVLLNLPPAWARTLQPNN